MITSSWPNTQMLRCISVMKHTEARVHDWAQGCHGISRVYTTANSLNAEPSMTVVYSEQPAPRQRIVEVFGWHSIEEANDVLAAIGDVIRHHGVMAYQFQSPSKAGKQWEVESFIYCFAHVKSLCVERIKAVVTFDDGLSVDFIASNPQQLSAVTEMTTKYLAHLKARN